MWNQEGNIKTVCTVTFPKKSIDQLVYNVHGLIYDKYPSHFVPWPYLFIYKISLIHGCTCDLLTKPTTLVVPYIQDSWHPWLHLYIFKFMHNCTCFVCAIHIFIYSYDWTSTYLQYSPLYESVAFSVCWNNCFTVNVVISKNNIRDIRYLIYK